MICLSKILVFDKILSKSKEGRIISDPENDKLSMREFSYEFKPIVHYLLSGNWYDVFEMCKNAKYLIHPTVSDRVCTAFLALVKTFYVHDVMQKILYEPLKHARQYGEKESCKQSFTKHYEFVL